MKIPWGNLSRATGKDAREEDIELQKQPTNVDALHMPWTSTCQGRTMMKNENLGQRLKKIYNLGEIPSQCDVARCLAVSILNVY
jgi:hypothetical protein